MADIHIKENTKFNRGITKDNPADAIVALPRDPVPQGITINEDTGQVSGIPRNIPDTGSSFRVAYAQITGGRSYKTTEHRFIIGTSRPPVWDRSLQYFWVTGPINIDLSIYVSGRSPITFEEIEALPSWLTLVGSTLSGTNPLNAMTTVRIRAINADGTSEQHFIFARATDPRPIYGQAVYGVSRYPFDGSLPSSFDSLAPIWVTDADYFFNTADINIDLNRGYIQNQTIPIFTIEGIQPSWLLLSSNGILTGTNPRTAIIRVTIRATNENGFSDQVFYFARATDPAPLFGTAVYGQSYYT